MTEIGPTGGARAFVRALGRGDEASPARRVPRRGPLGGRVRRGLSSRRTSCRIGSIRTGAPLWTRHYLTTGAAELVTDLAADGAGNVYLGGWLTGALDPARPSAGGSDWFVLRLDAQGEPRGAWQGGTSGDDFATGLAVDTCGRVLLAGSTDGALPGATSSGRRDSILVRASLQ